MALPRMGYASRTRVIPVPEAAQAEKESAAAAGLVVISLFIGNLGIKPLTTPLMRRLGIRSVLLGSITASAACLVGLALVGEDTPLALLVALLTFSGIARSTGFSAYNSVAFSDVEPERMTQANTLMSSVQELGAGFGVAVGAVLVRLGGSFSDAAGLGHGADEPFRIAFLLLAVLLVVPAIEALVLPRSAGDAVTGRYVTAPGPLVGEAVRQPPGSAHRLRRSARRRRRVDRLP